jgi:hypothetical protein
MTTHLYTSKSYAYIFKLLCCYFWKGVWSSQIQRREERWNHGRLPEGPCTRRTEGPWPLIALPAKHSHWWKRRSSSKFASLSAGGTNGVYKWMQGRAQHFPSNLYPYPNHNHQHRSMPTHAIQIAPVYQKLCLPTYTRSWLDQTHKRSFIVIGFSPKRFLVSVFPTSKKFDSDLELDAGVHKTDAHPCPPMNNNIAPMATQNPWAWVWAPNVGLCSIVNSIGRTCASNLDFDKYILPITITKSWEVRFLIWLLRTFHRRFANATQVLLCKSTW